MIALPQHSFRRVLKLEEMDASQVIFKIMNTMGSMIGYKS